MAAFKGFKTKETTLIPVPERFFYELLPEIDHLGELKLALYALWRASRTEGSVAWFQYQDLLADQLFLAGLAPDTSTARHVLDESLERALQRGFLLQAEVEPLESVLGRASSRQVYYFLNTANARAAIQALQAGQWRPGDIPQAPLELQPERPNIFSLYESHFGPLTPLIAETLREAEAAYPPDWIEDAILAALKNNVRRWRYVEAILQSWKEKGRKDDRTDRTDTEEARRQAFKDLAGKLPQ